MKRKDWKIKKSKKNIFGKVPRRRRKIYLLRELNLRKYNVFLNKDLIPQYKYYKFLINLFYSKSKYSQNLYYYYNNFNRFNYLFPMFYFKKKVFGYFNFFKNFILNNKLNYFTIKNNLYKNKLFGNNIIIFNENKKNLDLKLFEDEETLKLLYYKHFYEEIKFDNNFSFFFNYNIYFLNIIEVYKIIILLYLNKLK